MLSPGILSLIRGFQTELSCPGLGYSAVRETIVFVLLVTAVLAAVSYGAVTFQTPYGRGPNGVAQGPGIDSQVLAKPCVYVYFTLSQVGPKPKNATRADSSHYAISNRLRATFNKSGIVMVGLAGFSLKRV